METGKQPLAKAKEGILAIAVFPDKFGNNSYCISKGFKAKGEWIDLGKVFLLGDEFETLCAKLVPEIKEQLSPKVTSA